MRLLGELPLRLALLVLAPVLLASCARGGQGGPVEPPTPTSTPAQPGIPGVITGDAPIDKVNILVLESFPVQIRVMFSGVFSDSCPSIDKVAQERASDTFKIHITTKRQANQMCAQVITPFEQTVALDVAGLPKGTYTVEVNGVTETFTLTQDNVLK